MPTLYTVALNFEDTYAALAPAMNAPPYVAPPRAPVLTIKPQTCRIADGAPILLPPEVSALRMGGTLAVVIGRTAFQIETAHAADYISGYAVANDVSIPESSFFRPAISQRCRDGFCPVGEIAPASSLERPDAAEVRIFINDRLRLRANTSSLRRNIATLLADMTAFMTLDPGDIVLVGEALHSPLASEHDSVRIEIDGLPSLTNTIQSEVAA